MHHRRMFLQAGAALAVPAIGGALLTRERTSVEAACAACGDDPVSAEAMRQFKAAIRALQKSHKGEHARQAGAALRVIAASGRTRHLDAQFRGAVEQEVATFGRDNVLLRPFDREQFAANAREFGWVPAPELLRNPTLAERQQTLENLLAGGLTTHIERSASFFELVGADLDARRPVRLAQTTKEEQIAACKNLQNLVFQSEVAMIVACLFGTVVACAYFSGVYVGVRYYYEYETECSKWLG
jgi:hypothetical protein